MEGESKIGVVVGGGRGVGRSGGVFGKQNCSENEPALFILNVVFQLVWEKTQLFRSECSLFSSSLYKKSVLKWLLLQKCLLS